MRPLSPNPANGTLDEIEEALRCSVDHDEHCRFQGIKMLLLGLPDNQVCQVLSVVPRSLQRWVQHWNAGGIDRLKRIPRPGRPRKANKEQRFLVVDWLTHPEQHGQTHWTLRKLHGVLRSELRIELGYSTLARLVRDERFALNMPRSWPAKQDAEARLAFTELLSSLLASDPNRIWFYDESGITGDPRPRRRWMRKGERQTVPFTGTHLRENILGAVQPLSGRLFSLQMPEVDRELFQIFLDHFAEYTKGERVTMVLDNASWHKVKSLNWHHIQPIFLPPYSPDLNPIERLWLYIKEHYFNHWYSKSREELRDRVTWAIQQLLNQPEIVKSVTRV